MLSAIAVRLIGVTDPFVTKWNWRETDVAMIAENFYRHGFNLFYPQINWGGPPPGYVGTELPIVPFVAALLYPLFGVHEWVGRSIAIGFFGVSAMAFWSIVARVLSRRGALTALALYCFVPLSIECGRSFMPDIASAALGLLALCLFLRWYRSPLRWQWATIGTLLGLAILIKPPVVQVAAAMAAVAGKRYGWRRIGTMRSVWLFVSLSVVPSLPWYVHAYRLSVTYPPYHFFGSGAVMPVSVQDYFGVGGNIIEGLTPVVVSLMLVGVILARHADRMRPFYWWLVAFVVFAVVAAPGNRRHPWYQLLLVPVALTFAGYALDTGLGHLVMVRCRRTVAWVAGALMAAAFVYSSWTSLRPFYQWWAVPELRLGREIDAIAPPDALVAAIDGGDPALIYYAHRNGWHFLSNFGALPRSSDEAIAELEHLRERGARYLLVPNHSFWWLEYFDEFGRYLGERYRRVRMTEDYMIFDLTRISP